MNHTWLILMIASLLISGCEKYQLDEQVRELCAKDGGIKVYETVTLPPDMFDKRGQPNFYQPTQGEAALGPEYLMKRETYYYLNGEYEKPAMWQDHYQIYRVSDKSLLGESVRYARRGGDIPGPWHPSSFGCPNDAGIEPMLKRIFLKQNAK